MSTEWQVPILGVVMHDLVALETVLKDRIEVGEQKLVNFHKLVQVSGILKHVLKASNEQPNVFPKKEVFNIIRVSTLKIKLLSICSEMPWNKCVA